MLDAGGRGSFLKAVSNLKEACGQEEFSRNCMMWARQTNSMIIDFHTHIFPSFFRNERNLFFNEEPAFETLYRSPKSKLVGRGALLKKMDEDGINQSVIFGFPWQQPDHFRRHNDYIIESVERHPDRLIGFCSFAPQSTQAPKEAERCLESGLSGVGELAIYDPGISSNDIMPFGEIMKICSHFEVPLLLHTNEPVGGQYPGKTPLTLNQVYNFLKRYPLNRIVLSHWGGGLFFYTLMKRGVKEVLGNVWFDTAASPYLYTPDIYRVAVEIIGFGKILFGSDYPLLNPGKYLKEMESANLSPRSIKGIAGENAAHLLRLSS